MARWDVSDVEACFRVSRLVPTDPYPENGVYTDPTTTLSK